MLHTILLYISLSFIGAIHQWFLIFCRLQTLDEKLLDTLDPLSIFFDYELRRIKATADHRLRTAAIDIKYTIISRDNYKIFIRYYNIAGI